jgi:hypothetical protein
MVFCWGRVAGRDEGLDELSTPTRWRCWRRNGHSMCADECLFLQRTVTAKTDFDPNGLRKHSPELPIALSD